MRKLFGFLCLFILSLISITHSCNVNNKKPVEQMSVARKCYLLRKLPEWTTANDPLLQHDIFYYVSELCTKTHRLVVYASKNIKIYKTEMNRVLDHVLEGVNFDIVKYDRFELTTKQRNRLNRYLLEKVFYHEYKILRPNTTFLLLNVPKLDATYRLKENIGKLPKIYDNTTIIYYIGRSNFGKDIVISRLVP